VSNQKVNLDDIHHLENNTRTYYKERYIKENDLEQKLIVTYSPLPTVPIVHSGKTN